MFGQAVTLSRCSPLHPRPPFYCNIVHSREAVRPIRARVQLEIRWAFVTSCCVLLSQQKHEARGRSPRPPPRSLTATADIKKERGSWNESSTNHTLISANLLHMFLHHVHCFVFLMRSYRPCMLLFCAPVQWFLSLQKTRKKKKKTRFGFCYLMPPSSLLRCFLLFEPLPVSSRCHFAFHPHPLVRISAALLCVSVGEYGSLWVLLCNCHVCLQ